MAKEDDMMFSKKGHGALASSSLKTVPFNSINFAILMFWFINLRSEKENVFKDVNLFFSQTGSALTSYRGLLSRQAEDLNLSCGSGPGVFLAGILRQL